MSNNRYQLNEAQSSLLHGLLDRFERSNGSRMISLRVSEERFPAYFRDEDPAEVSRWEESVRSLRALGWVALDYGKGADRHRIVRIRLEPGAAGEIEAALGRTSLREFRARAGALLAAQAQKAGERPGLEAWSRWLVEEGERLAGADIPAGRRTSLLEELQSLCDAVFALLEQRRLASESGQTLTWRQFAVKHFSDSKRLDAMKPRLTKVLGSVIASGTPEEADESVVLSHFGIQSKEEIFLLRGPVVARDPGRRLEIEAELWEPFLPLSETMANGPGYDLDLSSVDGILTIENEEPFHSWCRRGLRPNWLCVYLGGFPSRSKIRWLQRLAVSGKPFFHWGDLDPGGIAIFRFLWRELAGRVKPIGMEPFRLEELHPYTRPMDSAELAKLRRRLETEDPTEPLHDLMEALFSHGRKLEQEALLDPFAPTSWAVQS